MLALVAHCRYLMRQVRAKIAMRAMHGRQKACSAVPEASTDMGTPAEGRAGGATVILAELGQAAVSKEPPTAGTGSCSEPAHAQP